jgi:hypothetical protein
MLSDVPLTGAVDFQARGSHDDVPRSEAMTDRQQRHHRGLPSAHSAAVRNRQIESQQLQERRNKALRRPQAEMKHRVQHQCALDGRIGIDFGRSSTSLRVSVPPGVDCFLVGPKGQPTSGDQRSIVGWPVAPRYRKVYSFDVIPYAGTLADHRQADTPKRFMHQRQPVSQWVPEISPVGVS